MTTSKRSFLCLQEMIPSQGPELLRNLLWMQRTGEWCGDPQLSAHLQLNAEL